MSQDLSVKITVGAALAGSYKSTFDSSKKALKTHVRAVGDAVKEHRLFSTVIQHTKEALGKHVRSIGDAVKQHRLYNSVMQRSEERMTVMKSRQEALNDKLRDSKARWLALGAAILATTKIIGSGMDTETQGLYLRTVINAPNKDYALGQSMTHARSFARHSLASDKEVLKIEYALNSAGLSAEVSRSGTELVHKLGKVTQGAPELVGEVFATTLNNLGANMEGSLDDKMNRISNVLAKTQFKFQIRDFGQLGESMKYAASTMAGMNVQFEQGVSAIGQLNSAGLQGSMAGTSFNAVIKNMGKASEELGFEMVRGADGSLDLIATLENLKQALDGMDVDERGELLQELFADEGKRGIIPLLDQLDQLKAAHKEVAAAAKSDMVNEEYKRFMDSSAGQAQMFWQNLKMIGDVLAGTFLPGLNMVLTPVGKLLGFIGWAIEKFPPLGWIIGGLTTAIIGVAAAQMVWTAAQWALNSAMLANPITWVIAGIVAVGLAVAWIVKHWDKAWNAIKWVTTKVWEGIKRAFAWSPIGLVVRFWRPLVGFFGSIWGGIKSGIESSWTLVKRLFSWSPIGLLLKAWKPVTKFLDWVWDKFKAIGRFFGIAAKTTGYASVGAAALIAATPAPAKAPALPPIASSRVVQRNHSTVNAPITIHQQPGQNADDVAAAVRKELDERQRVADAEKREALHD